MSPDPASPSVHTRSIASEGRALLAVARKEWLIFRRYASWILAVLIWPVLLPFGFIFTARALSGPEGQSLDSFAALSGTTDYITYIVIGTLLWNWLNMTLWDVGLHMRNEQMRGTLESNWLCPIPRITLMLGGSLTKLALSLLFLAISVVEFWLVWDVRLVRGNVPLVLLVLLLLIPSIYGIGIAFGSLVLRFKEANAMVYFVRGVFLIFCGITYPLAVMPGWMQEVAAWLPLTYAIRAMRAASLSGASLAEVWPDLRALVLFALLLPLLGYLIFSIIERRARGTGSLAHY